MNFSGTFKSYRVDGTSFSVFVMPAMELKLHPSRQSDVFISMVSFRGTCGRFGSRMASSNQSTLFQKLAKKSP
jgi:hypothetical protein